MLSPLSEVRLVFRVSPYLNILCISSEKHTTLKIPINSMLKLTGINLSMTFNYCTQCRQNSQSMLIMNVSVSTGIESEKVYLVP